MSKRHDTATYDMSVRIWPELREAIRLRADMDWRLYTIKSIEVDDLDAPITETVEFDAICYNSKVRWRYQALNPEAFAKHWTGKTYGQAIADGTLGNPPKLTIQPSHFIGPTDDETRRDWYLFATLCLDAWEATEETDTEMVVGFDPELRAALRRRRGAFIDLARHGSLVTPSEAPRAWYLGIAYRWLAELADIAIALETER